ncbi:MAG: TRAM domain-containing protein [Nanoarchaeota archaeon]
MRNDRGPRRDFSRQNFAPVKVGDELNVKIEAVGEKGDGIAKKDGFVLFIPNTKQGDEVRVKITRVLPKVGFAEVIGEKTEESSESSGESREGSEGGYEPAESESKEPSEDYEGGQDTENFGEEN